MYSFSGIKKYTLMHIGQIAMLRTMSVYQIYRNRQCLNDLRVRTYDLGTFTAWL